jgi:hypothetical protein
VQVAAEVAARVAAECPFQPKLLTAPAASAAAAAARRPAKASSAAAKGDQIAETVTPSGGGGGGGGDEEKENRPTIGEPLDEPLDEPTGRAPGCGPNGGDHTGRSGGGVLHRAAATGEGGRPLKDPCLKSPGQGRPVRLPPSLLDVAARTEADRQRRDDAEVTLPTRPDPARVDTNTDLLPPL